MNSVYIAYKIVKNEITDKIDIDFGFVSQNFEKVLNFWNENQDYILTQEKVVE